MQLPCTPAAKSAVFDDPNLVSSAGLVRCSRWPQPRQDPAGGQIRVLALMLAAADDAERSPMLAPRATRSGQGSACGDRVAPSRGWLRGAPDLRPEHEVGGSTGESGRWPNCSMAHALVQAGRSWSRPATSTTQ